jgi:hypothetical protein
MDSALEGSGHTFDISFRAESNCLVANVAGWIDGIDALIAMFTRIGAELRRTHCTRLLVLDHTHGVVPPEDEMKRLMTAVEGRGLSAVRIAYVDTRGTAVSRMEVGEILGREHGYKCRVFDNERRARIWLNYGED